MNDFKYRYGMDRAQRSASGTRRIRLLVLFIIVLAVTGGIIYCLVPHGTLFSGDKPAPPSAGTTTTTAATDVPSGAPGSEGGGNNSASVAGTASGTSDAGVATSGTEVSDAGNAPSADGGEKTEQVADVPAKEKDAGENPVTAADATEFPQKGKPWVGDPPEERPSAAKPEQPVADDQRLSPLYSGSTGELGTLVIVRPGESLSRLAARHRTTVEALRYFNKLKKDNIRIGQKLRLIPGPWRITIDKSRRELLLERSMDGSWQNFAAFQVGLGRLNSTPAADFVISTRLRHPDWYTPDGRIIRYGDPENQLGDYFLKLARSGSPDKPLIGYGIHGTGDESTVGKNWSRGCVRMRNRDVGILYYLVPTGTPVRIIPGEADVKKLEK